MVVLLVCGGSNDLYFGDGIIYLLVSVDCIIMDGEVVMVGGIVFIVYFMLGYILGSIVWIWIDICDGKLVCIVYVDSLSVLGYQLKGNFCYLCLIEDYKCSFVMVWVLFCDLLFILYLGVSNWNYVVGSKVSVKVLICNVYVDVVEKKFDV